VTRSRTKPATVVEGPTAPDVPALLRVEGLSKRFRRGHETVVALDGVDLDVRAGEFVALVGRSGSGKSTLLHLCGGLDVPDRGRVVLGERDVTAMNAGERALLRRREVGFVFQFFHLIPTLSVTENVALPLVLDRRRDAETQARSLLDAVGLPERADHLPGELSGGEMHRAAIARALVHAPRVLLADEPTGNLDSATAAAVLDTLCERVRDNGCALLLVTHDPTVAARADRSLTLSDGRLSVHVTA
jgi:predicted ABC-type transport system involved in lysophospholipase L1 biosynthesis ATPase subunit